MSKKINRSLRNSDAVFLGRQKRPLGIPLALYNITAVDHPSYGSSVYKDTLRKLNLQIPQVQHPQGLAKLLLTSGKKGN